MTVDFHPYFVELELAANEAHSALTELAVRPSVETASSAALAIENARNLIAAASLAILEGVAS